MDYGAAGLLDQIKQLNTNEIQYFGAGKNSQAAFAPLILEMNGQKIALIGVNDIETWYTASGANSAGSAYLSETLIKSAIKLAKTKADIVIIEPHWGFEYYLNYVAAQKDWAHKFIDWGADIVVGGHPHVIEANETYKGKKIYFSLGNFLFDEMPQVPHAGDCQILSVEITDGKIAKQSLINVKLDSKGYPYLK
jgi:poly-gamma-glutamate synthesis protein (capsule biosynthesis protein)